MRVETFNLKGEVWTGMTTEGLFLSFESPCRWHGAWLMSCWMLSTVSRSMVYLLLSPDI